MPANRRPFHRPMLDELVTRLREPRRFVQVLAGPRQSGKTTLARQAIDVLGLPARYASADEPFLRGRAWIEEQWEASRAQARQSGRGGTLLVLDEVQKVTGWAETVKRLWDEDARARLPLKVIVLGSAPLLVQRGLTESLAGRFELLRVPHWSFAEMRGAFGWSLERYLYFGGYPGAAPQIGDRDRWARYILDSLVETTISRDILLLARVASRLSSAAFSSSAPTTPGRCCHTRRCSASFRTRGTRRRWRITWTCSRARGRWWGSPSSRAGACASEARARSSRS